MNTELVVTKLLPIECFECTARLADDELVVTMVAEGDALVDAGSL